MKLNIAYVTVLVAAILIPSAFADSVSTDIDSVSYDIEYTGNNVVLKSATADLDFISLIFETEVIWLLKAMYLLPFNEIFLMQRLDILMTISLSYLMVMKLNLKK